MSYFKFQLSNISCQVSAVKCQVSNFSCLISVVKGQLSNAIVHVHLKDADLPQWVRGDYLSLLTASLVCTQLKTLSIKRNKLQE